MSKNKALNDINESVKNITASMEAHKRNLDYLGNILDRRNNAVAELIKDNQENRENINLIIDYLKLEKTYPVSPRLVKIKWDWETLIIDKILTPFLGIASVSVVALLVWVLIMALTGQIK